MIPTHFHTRLAAHLAWPFHQESVMAIALLYILGNLLLAISGIERRFDSTSLQSLLHWSSVMLFLTLLFHYGLDIIETSARGAERPPRIAPHGVARQIYDTITEQLGFNLSTVEYRLLRQQLMVMAYLGIAQLLAIRGYTWLALALQVLFVLMLPAALGVNAIAENKLHMANPLKLAEFAVATAQDYVIAELALVAAYVCYQGAISATPLAFQLLLPASLYFSVVTFRAVGAGIRRRKNLFFQEADFDAERKALETVSVSRKPVGEMLEEVHELLRAQNSAKALELLCNWTRHLGDWKHFDEVFSYVAAWPFRNAGLHLVETYLPDCLRQHRYMRALDLCEWSLAQDPSFTVASASVLHELAEQAAAPRQYTTVCRLIENHRDADPATRLTLLKLAARIALTHLNDEKRFQQLQQQMAQLPQAS